MDLVHATVSQRTGSSGHGARPAQPDGASSPAELESLIAAANAAATVPSGEDHAIWEDACRRLAVGARPAAARAAVPAGPRKVLVVDGSSTAREAMRKILDSAGYAVLVAPDSAKALALAQQQQADLVLTDVEAPATDGLNFISRLREIASHRLTPIMMLMAAAQDAKKIAGRRAGADGWIGKPIDPQRFIAIVQKVCPAG